MQTQVHKKNKKIFLILAASIVGLIVVYIFVASANSLWPFQPNQNASTTTPEESWTNKKLLDKNTSDPTYSSEKINSSKSSNSTQSASTPSSKTSVQVGITSVSKQGNDVEVHAFISGAIEGTGVCTATLTKDGVSITGSSEAFIDASTTQCDPIEISEKKLSPGEWKVTVTYESATHKGISSAMEVTL